MTSAAVIPIPQSRERNLALDASFTNQGRIPLPRLRDRNDTGVKGLLTPDFWLPVSTKISIL